MTLYYICHIVMLGGDILILLAVGGGTILCTLYCTHLGNTPTRRQTVLKKNCLFLHHIFYLYIRRVEFFTAKNHSERPNYNCVWIFFVFTVICPC